MSRRIFAVTVSQAQVGALLAVAVLGVPSFVHRAPAANVYVADTNLTLTDPSAFVGAALPAPGVDIVVFGGSVNGATNTSYLWSVGAASTDNSWGGISVLDPGADITITDGTYTLGLARGGIDMSAATRNLKLDAGLILGSDQTWNVAAGRTLTVNGTVGGAGALTIAGEGHTAITGALQGSAMTLNKFGVGTLTLSSQNTYTGLTTVGSKDNSAGTLSLDFSGADAPTTNIVNSALTVSNAAINLIGNANFAASQTFNGMTASWGLTTLSCTSSGAGVTVNLGTIGRAYNQGISVRIIPNVNATLSTFSATNAAAGSNNGLVEKNNISSTANNAGPYMTYGLNDYASVVSGIIGAATYVSKVDGAAITSTANGSVYDILNGASGTVTSGAFNVEGLRFTGAGAKTFRLTGGSMVLGAVLVTPEVGTDTVTISSAGGSIRTQDNSDLVIWQNNTRGDLIFSAPLARRTTSSGYGSLVKNGTGTLVLTTTSNSLNGDMFINEGPVQINAASAMSSVNGTGIVLQGGGLIVNGTFANANGSYRHPIRVAGKGGTIEVTAGNTFTVTYPAASALLGSSLLTKTGAGSLALGEAASTWSGGLAIADGLVDVQAIAGTPLGSGPVSVNSGTLGISGSFTGSNALTVNGGGAITVTGTLTSAFTVNNGGTYLVNTGSVSGAITLLSGATVTGSGDTAAPMVLPSGAVIEPGSRLSLATMNFQDLTLRTGSILNMTVQGDANSADVLHVLPGGTLHLESNIVVNLFDAGSGLPYFSNGTYSLFSGVDVLGPGQYVGGSATHGTVTNFVAGNFDPHGVSSAAATFSIIGPATASSIIVTISGVVTASAWTGAGDGLWTSAGNWSAGVPGVGAGDQATFAGNVAPGTVDLGEVHRHLGILNIDSGTQGGSWTFVSTGGGKLLLDNGTSPTAIQIGNGAQSIRANMDLLSPTTFQFNSSGGALAVSGIIDTPTACALTIQGASSAVLTLTADNTIAGPIHIAGGILQIGSGGTTGSLGAGAVLNDAAVVFNRSDTPAVSNTISGSGTVTQMGSGTTTLTAAANYSGPTVIAAGQLAFGGGVSHSIAGVSGTGALAVATSTILTSDGVNLPAGSLIVDGTQTIRSSGTTGAYYNFATGRSSAMLIGTSKIAGAGLNITGTLDIKNNALIVEAADSTSKATLLATLAGELGTTITSSTATTNSHYTLDVIDNGQLGASFFGGLPVDPNSIIVTEALKGDANMDGNVTLADLTIWKANFGKANVYAANIGDFNHDGNVTLADLTIWKSNFGAGVGTYPAPSDASTGGLGLTSLPTATYGGGISAVPEPASLAVLALGAVGLLARRRKNMALGTCRR